MHGGAGGAGGQKKPPNSGASQASGKKSKGAGASRPGTEFGSIFAESFGMGASVFGGSVDGEDRDEGNGTAGIEGLNTVCHLPHISETEASTNLAVIAKYSRNFLPVRLSVLVSCRVVVTNLVFRLGVVQPVRASECKGRGQRGSVATAEAPSAGGHWNVCECGFQRFDCDVLHAAFANVWRSDAAGDRLCKS
jgi:hypothetical protein